VGISCAIAYRDYLLLILEECKIYTFEFEEGGVRIIKVGGELYDADTGEFFIPNLRGK
jgi:hypothetical protein